MARSIAVAAVQLAAHDRDNSHAGLERALDATHLAAREADLVVLPEATFPAYVLGKAPLGAHEAQDAIERLRVIARETSTVIVAGAAVLRNGRARNAAVVIDTDGSLAGHADKLFLWHFDRRWFEEGQRLAPIGTKIGLLGVLICADGRLPTIARALADQGAEVLVMPTAWVTSGRDPQALENVQADLLARVRAYENRVPFVAANKCGSELNMVAYCGKSQIIDVGGEIVALASEREPEILRATVTFGGVRPSRVETVYPPLRQNYPAAPLRLAISYESLPADIDERLELLDDAYALSSTDSGRLELLDATIPSAPVDDRRVLDPGGLVPYRRAGYGLLCWTSDIGPPWLERIARARAVELRVYLVVFDRSAQRAFAVDPDGAIVAGTFAQYRLASFTFDPRRTGEMLVAPGTDVAEGLARVEAIVADGSF
jgi:predicted amidohydrolase